ncbi:aldo/keto reductase [Ruminococcus flavefaciens]|uniref:aldo/keto reductase n=1 Tax=Ruminococcus flavefaciens TaxID=1265 RepID=UPI0026F160D8|nr:aldo/keto reductase [Ruminococcus flavefaciens]
MFEGKGTVKWGVMGTAGIASWGTIPGMQKAKGCELYAIAGRSLEKAQAYKERFGFEKAYKGYEALLSDPEVEAVYIPLPNDIHCEWVIKALNAHKHVLCEKPLAMNECELRRMFAAARENGVILMEAYAYLHSPYIARLKEIISSGEIGKVDYIDTAFLTQDYSDDIRLHKEQGGGGIYDVGCYCTSMILSLIDSPVKYIKADAEFGGTGVDHMASVLIGFEDGSRASFNAGMILGTDTNDRYDRLFIHGSKGYIRSDVEYNGEGELSFEVTVKDSNYERVTRTETVAAGSNYSMEMEQMNECIKGKASPYITEEFSVKNMRILENILDAVGYNDSKKQFVLPNGTAIPAVGYGSYLSTEKSGVQTIIDALEVGYRYIDTAQFYGNEEQIGEAIERSGIPREEIFLCSKVWHTDLGKEKTLRSFEESCRKLKTAYLDMYLIHWPKSDVDDEEWFEKVRDSWAAMEELYEQGKIKAIGLSNFLPHHIRPLLEVARIRPMVDQLELHVGYMQEYTLSYLRKEGILPQAWSPLGRAKLINDGIVSKIAAKYGCTNAALLLRYLNQRGIPVIPKASSKERMKENLNIFGFRISADDMSYLSSLPERGWSGEHPDET